MAGGKKRKATEESADFLTLLEMRKITIINM